MQELLLGEPYTCTPVCKVVVALEGMVAAIGPAGDALYVPMRITGGSVVGVGPEGRIVGGSDIAVMYGDEMFVHNGTFIIADPAGDIVVWYDGPSAAAEGSYDDVLDGRLPGRSACRLNVRTISTGPKWRSLNRRPLLGVGFYDGSSGTLEFTILTVTESPAVN
jgi:hypothetical protein